MTKDGIQDKPACFQTTHEGSQVQLVPCANTLDSGTHPMDIKEGADMIMVKPGMPYLDIIKMKTATLISCASEIGCIVANNKEDVIKKFGVMQKQMRHFQLFRKLKLIFSGMKRMIIQLQAKVTFGLIQEKNYFQKAFVFYQKKLVIKKLIV